MQPFEYLSLMVQREQWDTYWWRKKLIFLIREIDDATIAGASVESCQFVTRRSLGGRSESSLDTCNRLRRVRRRFQCKIHLPRSFALYLYWPWFAKDFDQSSPETTKR